MKVTREFAERFAAKWIEAWNAHDLQRILSHYSVDFRMASPVIRHIAGEPSGRLEGREAVGNYWRLALERQPSLRFELREVLCGADSVTLLYSGPRGSAAEVFVFGDDGLVREALAHYGDELNRG